MSNQRWRVRKKVSELSQRASVCLANRHHKRHNRQDECGYPQLFATAILIFLRPNIPAIPAIGITARIIATRASSLPNLDFS